VEERPFEGREKIALSNKRRQTVCRRTGFWVAQRFQRCDRALLFCRGLSPCPGRLPPL